MEAKPSDAGIERGDFTATMDAAHCRDWHERSLIVFLADLSPAKDADADHKIKSSAMAMKAALSCLHHYAGQNLRCYPSMGKIGRRMNCSPRTAREAVSDLVDELKIVAYRDNRIGEDDRDYVLDYGAILERFVIDPPDWLASAIDNPPADSAGVGNPPAKSAGPPGGFRHTPRRNLPETPAKSAYKTNRQLEVKNEDHHQGRDDRSADLQADDCGTDRPGGNGSGMTAVLNAEWRMTATAFLRKVFYNERMIAQTLDRLMTKDRWMDVLKIIERREKRARESGEKFDVCRYIHWLSKNPDVTYATAFKSAKAKYKH